MYIKKLNFMVSTKLICNLSHLLLVMHRSLLVLGVFKRFTGDDGKFERSLTEDAKGILSLYEAAHLGTTTDYILDEALEFTSSHLKSLLVGGMCRPHILRLIRNTLYLPQRWNMEAVIAREYISFYEQEEDHDKMLLRLAKLNFKLLQLHYIKELKTFIK